MLVLLLAGDGFILEREIDQPVEDGLYVEYAQRRVKRQEVIAGEYHLGLALDLLGIPIQRTCIDLVVMGDQRFEKTDVSQHFVTQIGGHVYELTGQGGYVFLLLQHGQIGMRNVFLADDTFQHVQQNRFACVWNSIDQEGDFGVVIVRG